MERWATVKRLHQAALELGIGQRAKFLDESCGGDEALRREVESLLTYEHSGDSFMETPAVAIAARSMRGEVDRPLIGRTLGHASERLGDDAFHAALLQGRAMSFTQAVQYALSETSHE